MAEPVEYITHRFTLPSSGGTEAIDRFLNGYAAQGFELHSSIALGDTVLFVLARPKSGG